MYRAAGLSILVLAVFATSARSVITTFLCDEFDDFVLVLNAWDDKAVQAFHKEINELEARLLRYEEADIQTLFGRPVAMPPKTYAMPVAQAHSISMSGIRSFSPEDNKDHREFYVIQDFAGLEVWYGHDGKSPQVIILYFKVDKHFPRLTDHVPEFIHQAAKRLNVERHVRRLMPKQLRARLAWDQVRFDRLRKVIEEREAGK
jgi:hypothetical protein